MDRTNQVVLRWDEHTRVVLTVHVLPFDSPATGEEWRLEQEIAALLWAEWNLAPIEAPRGQ
jgi:hypothetical protein